MSTPNVAVTRQRRPRAGIPAYNPAWLHPFRPSPYTRVPSQCRDCFGWYDDPRHIGARPRLATGDTP